MEIGTSGEDMENSVTRGLGYDDFRPTLGNLIDIMFLILKLFSIPSENATYPSFTFLEEPFIRITTYNCIPIIVYGLFGG